MFALRELTGTGGRWARIFVTVAIRRPAAAASLCRVLALRQHLTCAVPLVPTTGTSVQLAWWRRGEMFKQGRGVEV